MNEKARLPEKWLKGEIDRAEMVTDVKVVARLLAATRRTQNALIDHAKWMEDKAEENEMHLHLLNNKMFPLDPIQIKDKPQEDEPSRYCLICANKECDYQGAERGTATCQWEPSGPKEPEKVYPFSCGNCGVGERGPCELRLSECSGKNDFARWVRPRTQAQEPALRVTKISHAGYFREKEKFGLGVGSEYGNASVLTIKTSMGELGKWLYVTGEREKVLEAELNAEGFVLASSEDKIIPRGPSEGESETLTEVQQLYKGMKILRDLLPTIEEAAKALMPKKGPE